MPDVNPPDTLDSSELTQADIFAALARENDQLERCPRHGGAPQAALWRRGHQRTVFACGCVWNYETATLRSHDDDAED